MSRSLRVSTFWAFAVPLLCFGCSSQMDHIGKLQDSGTETGSDTSHENDASMNLGCTQMDILFVIDDSKSMECEQQMLVSAFPQFINVIENYTNEQTDELSYRIGITSTGRRVNWTMDMPPPYPDYAEDKEGMNGELVHEDGGLPWIEGPGDEASTLQAFSKRALIGTDGPTYEMPLECMRLAIQKSSPGQPNEGFLRENSLFIAVVITDEDDCSRPDEQFTVTNDLCTLAPEEHNLFSLEEYESYLNDWFNGRDRWVFVAIAGFDSCEEEVWASECNSGDNQSGALSAGRLRDFVDDYVNSDGGQNGLFSDICTNPLAAALSATFEKMEVACNDFVVE